MISQPQIHQTQVIETLITTHYNNLYVTYHSLLVLVGLKFDRVELLGRHEAR